MNIREKLKDKKRVVVKIGSSSLTHEQTGRLNLTKLEILVRELADLHNQGKDVIVVPPVPLRWEEAPWASTGVPMNWRRSRHVPQWARQGL